MKFKINQYVRDALIQVKTQIKNSTSIASAALFTAITASAVIAPANSAHAIEVDASQYQALYGDVNGDGLKDIYLTPKPQYIPIAGEVTVIIPLAGEGNSYKLLAQASGYGEPELDNSIDTALLSNADFQLLSGDFNGDGVEDTFVQSTSQSLLSLTLANNLVEDSPYVLQTFASFASDTHNLTISDLNADGRDDITYTVSNQSQTLYASNQGHLQSAGQGQVTANYGYDYLNKRRYKVVEKIGEPRQEVIYIDDHTELRDGQLQKYITLGGQKIARSSQADGEFAPVEFYLNNHLGSTALTLDSTASIKNAFTYEPYGDKQVAYGETDLAPYGFTGKEQDPETQLGYFHHRYLNSKVGQFITPDPVFAMDDRFVDPQSWSPYAYARNNPIVYRDPDGQFFVPFLVAIGLGGGAALYSDPANAPNVNEKPISGSTIDKALSVTGFQAAKGGVTAFKTLRSGRQLYHAQQKKISNLYDELKAAGVDPKTIYEKVSDARTALKKEVRASTGNTAEKLTNLWDEYRHFVPFAGKKFSRAEKIKKIESLPKSERAAAYDKASKTTFTKTSPFADTILFVKKNNQ